VAGALHRWRGGRRLPSIGWPAAASEQALGAGDCEAWRGGPLGQPTNAVTSLALVAAGVWLAGRTRVVAPRQRWRPAGYGATLVAAGLGSVAYHGVGGAASERFHDRALAGALLATAAGAAEALRARTVPVAPARPATPRERWATRTVAVSATAAPLAYVLGRTSARTCRPTSRWQWHGLWHVLAGVAGATWGERTQVAPFRQIDPPRAARRREARP
jgi:hypothetical protein